jgi:hypothetical protein
MCNNERGACNAPHDAAKAPSADQAPAETGRGAVLPGPGRLMGGGDDKNKIPPSLSPGPLFADGSVSTEPSFSTSASASLFPEGPVFVDGSLSSPRSISGSAESKFRQGPVSPVDGTLTARERRELDAYGSGPGLGEPFRCTASCPWTPAVSGRLVLHPDARVGSGVRFCPHCGHRWEVER